MSDKLFVITAGEYSDTIIACVVMAPEGTDFKDLEREYKQIPPTLYLDLSEWERKQHAIRDRLDEIGVHFEEWEYFEPMEYFGKWLKEKKGFNVLEWTELNFERGF